MATVNAPDTRSRGGPDWGGALLFILALVLSCAVGLLAFRGAQSFFATTSVIRVGDAPPVLPAGWDGQPSATPNRPGITPSPQPTPTAAEGLPAGAAWSGTRPVTLLVMGLDYRDWLEGVDVPRTDTMILFSIDPLKKTAGMLSIPRDMWVSIPGFGYSRINTAYRDGEIYKLPGGGMGLAMKTVEQFVGVPVDYAALIDFNSFVKFIDELGGLDMHIREPIKVDPIGPGNTITLQPGVQTLDGATVLGYARNRYTADGDFDRARRQQEVIMALRDQILTFHQLPMLIQKAPKLYHELSSGIRTNLALDQVIQLALLAAQVDEKDIQRGVFDPHTDVNYASVITPDGAASVLVPNPDRIRLLTEKVFGGNSLGPTAGGDLAARAKAEGARVLVKNGARSADRGSQASVLFNTQGIQASDGGKADSIYSQTTIIDHSGKPYTIQYLTELLQIPSSRVKMDFNPDAPADLEITIGLDWKGAVQ
jgi:polyisoprenyl-teichoic acid--peptidoglycan teichoic acid transferase